MAALSAGWDVVGPLCLNGGYPRSGAQSCLPWHDNLADILSNGRSMLAKFANHAMTSATLLAPHKKPRRPPANARWQLAWL